MSHITGGRDSTDTNEGCGKSRLMDKGDSFIWGRLWKKCLGITDTGVALWSGDLGADGAGGGSGNPGEEEAGTTQIYQSERRGD